MKLISPMIPASFLKDSLTRNLALAGIIGEISFEFLQLHTIDLLILFAACNLLPNSFRYAAVYKFEPSQEETSSFELVRWTFGCFFAVQYSISIMAILNLLPFCCSLLNINHDSQFAAFLLFNTPDQS